VIYKILIIHKQSTGWWALPWANFWESFTSLLLDIHPLQQRKLIIF